MSKDFPKDIKYDYTTHYVGRNGFGKQIGLAITTDGSTLLFEPINSKNHIAHCEIRIPYDKIPDLIHELSRVLYILSE